MANLCEGYKEFMNQIIKACVAISALAVLATSSFASTIVGTWHGHVKIDRSKMPPAKDARMQSRLQEGFRQSKNAVITITFKADHTFIQAVSGVNPTPPTKTGTWTQAGNAVTLQGTVNGKNVGPSATVNLGKNDKSFVVTPNAFESITFSR